MLPRIASSLGSSHPHERNRHVAWGPLFSLRRPRLATHRGCLAHEASDCGGGRVAALRLAGPICAVGAGDLPRRAAERAQLGEQSPGSKARSVSSSSSCRHRFPACTLCLRPRWDRGPWDLLGGPPPRRRVPPGADTTGPARPWAPASARCGSCREGPGARSRRATAADSRDRRPAPPRPFRGEEWGRGGTPFPRRSGGGARRGGGADGVVVGGGGGGGGGGGR